MDKTDYSAASQIRIQGAQVDPYAIEIKSLCSSVHLMPWYYDHRNGQVSAVVLSCSTAPAFPISLLRTMSVHSDLLGDRPQTSGRVPIQSDTSYLMNNGASQN